MTKWLWECSGCKGHFSGSDERTELRVETKKGVTVPYPSFALLGSYTFVPGPKYTLCSTCMEEVEKAIDRPGAALRLALAQNDHQD